MKKALAISLSVLVFLCALGNVGLSVYFKSNQQAIAAASCTNKDKPALKCHGKCQLRKWFEEKNDRDCPVPFGQNPLEDFKVNLFAGELFVFGTKETDHGPTAHFPQPNPVAQSFLPAVFRPPIL